MGLKIWKPFERKQTSCGGEEKVGKLQRIAAYIKDKRTILHKPSPEDGKIVCHENANTANHRQTDHQTIIEQTDSCMVAHESRDIAAITAHVNTVSELSTVSVNVGAPHLVTRCESSDVVNSHIIQRLSRQDILQATFDSTRSDSVEDAKESIINAESSYDIVQNPVLNCCDGRQVSATSTLPVSIRSHASEPDLRYHNHKQISNLEKLEEPLKILSEWKDQEEERWNLVLSSREENHLNELEALGDEHEHELKDLKETLQAAGRSKTYLQKLVKKENVKRKNAEQESKDLKTQAVLREAQSVQRYQVLQAEHNRLLEAFSAIQARETNHTLKQETLVAEVKQAQELRDSMARIAADAKREWDYARLKLQDMNWALEGTPTADDVDKKGQIEAKTKQIQDLTQNTIHLSAELEKLEKSAAEEKLKARQEVENLTSGLSLARSAMNDLQKRFYILQKSEEDLLAYPRYELRRSPDALAKAASEVVENLREEVDELEVVVRKTQAARAGAEEDRLVWKHRYENLLVELGQKNKLNLEIEATNMHLENENGRLDIELAAVEREKDDEIRLLLQRLSSHEEMEQARRDRMHEFAMAGGSAQAEWFMRLKVAENEELQKELRHAKRQLHCNQQYLDEKKQTEGEELAMAHYEDRLLVEARQKLQDAEIECAQLKLRKKELSIALDLPRFENNPRTVSRQQQRPILAAGSSRQNADDNKDSIDILLRHYRASVLSEDEIKGCGHDTASMETVEVFDNCCGSTIVQPPSVECGSRGGVGLPHKPVSVLMRSHESKSEPEAARTVVSIIRRSPKPENLFELYNKTNLKGKAKVLDVSTAGSVASRHTPLEDSWAHDQRRELAWTQAQSSFDVEEQGGEYTPDVRYVMAPEVGISDIFESFRKIAQKYQESGKLSPVQDFSANDSFINAGATDLEHERDKFLNDPDVF